MKIAKHLAQSAGTTVCQFSFNGKKVYVSGKDGLLEFDAENDDVEPTAVESHHDDITALAASNNFIATGSKDRSVMLYPSGNLTNYATVTRLTLAVNSVAFSLNGQFLAVGGEDLDIKLLTLSNEGTVSNTQILKGQTHAVRSLAFDPKAKYLASLAANGNVVIWDIEKGTAQLSKEILYKRDISQPLGTLHWNFDGNCLAVPADKAIKLLKRTSWTEVGSISTPNAPTVIAFSHNGNFIAATCNDSLLLYCFQNGAQIAAYPFDGNLLTGLSWSLMDNRIAVCDLKGNLHLLTDFIPADFKLPETDTLKEPATKENPVNLDAMFDFDAADDEAVEMPAPRRQKKAGPSTVKERTNDVDEFGFSRVDDYENVLEEADVDAPADDLQVSFQPSATPMINRRRLMAWNLVGYIIQREEHSHTNIDVEFHDRNLHRPIHFPDHNGFTMAALGQRGALFASELKEGGLLAIVHYVPFESWAPNSAWTISMNENESVVAIAMGRKYAIIANNSNHVRIISYSAFQKAVFAVPGQVISIAAIDDSFFLIYHAGQYTNGDSVISYWWYDLENSKMISQGNIPFTPNGNIVWIGFSELGNPCFYDSAGTLYSLYQTYGYLWMPILNTNSLFLEKKEKCWPVAVLENEMLAIMTKAPEYLPVILAKPVITNIRLRVPLIQPNTSISQIEERMMRMTAALPDKLSTLGPDEAAVEQDNAINTLDRALLELIKNATTTNRFVRVLDLCTMFHTARAFDDAIQFVQREKQATLAEKMYMLRERKFREEVSSVDNVTEIDDSKENQPEIPLMISQPIKKERKPANSLPVNLNSSPLLSRTADFSGVKASEAPPMTPTASSKRSAAINPFAVNNPIPIVAKNSASSKEEKPQGVQQQKKLDSFKRKAVQ